MRDRIGGHIKFDMSVRHPNKEFKNPVRLLDSNGEFEYIQLYLDSETPLKRVAFFKT